MSSLLTAVVAGCTVINSDEKTSLEVLDLISQKVRENTLESDELDPNDSEQRIESKTLKPGQLQDILSELDHADHGEKESKNCQMVKDIYLAASDGYIFEYEAKYLTSQYKEIPENYFHYTFRTQSPFKSLSNSQDPELHIIDRMLDIIEDGESPKETLITSSDTTLPDGSIPFRPDESVFLNNSLLLLRNTESRLDEAFQILQNIKDPSLKESISPKLYTILRKTPSSAKHIEDLALLLIDYNPEQMKAFYLDSNNNTDKRLIVGKVLVQVLGNESFSTIRDGISDDKLWPQGEADNQVSLFKAIGEVDSSELISYFNPDEYNPKNPYSNIWYKIRQAAIRGSLELESSTDTALLNAYQGLLTDKDFACQKLAATGIVQFKDSALPHAQRLIDAYGKVTSYKAKQILIEGFVYHISWSYPLNPPTRKASLDEYTSPLYVDKYDEIFNLLVTILGDQENELSLRQTALQMLIDASNYSQFINPDNKEPVFPPQVLDQMIETLADPDTQLVKLAIEGVLKRVDRENEEEVSKVLNALEAISYHKNQYVQSKAANAILELNGISSSETP
jgi:hypothetical protein